MPLRGADKPYLLSVESGMREAVIPSSWTRGTKMAASADQESDVDSRERQLCDQ